MASRTQSPVAESEQADLEAELDKASANYATAYEDYIDFYNSSLDSQANMREVIEVNQAKLETLEEAFEAVTPLFDEAVQAGLFPGGREDVLRRYVTKMRAWFRNQYAQNRAFSACGLSDSSDQAEYAECFVRNSRLIARGVRLAQDANMLQAELFA